MIRFLLPSLYIRVCYHVAFGPNEKTPMLKYHPPIM